MRRNAFVSQRADVERCLNSSVQDEADGRLLLHASHAAEAGYEAVMISSNDTDVFVLSIVFCSAVKATLYQRSGTSTRTQLIDIGKVASSLGPSVCTALPGLHSYTGCDFSVSSFAGKGKLSALKMLKSYQNVVQQAFSDLGKVWELSQEVRKFHLSAVCPETSNIWNQ